MVEPISLISAGASLVIGWLVERKGNRRAEEATEAMINLFGFLGEESERKDFQHWLNQMDLAGIMSKLDSISDVLLPELKSIIMKVSEEQVTQFQSGLQDVKHEILQLKDMPRPRVISGYFNIKLNNKPKGLFKGGLDRFFISLENNGKEPIDDYRVLLVLPKEIKANYACMINPGEKHKSEYRSRYLQVNPQPGGNDTISFLGKGNSIFPSNRLNILVYLENSLFKNTQYEIEIRKWVKGSEEAREVFLLKT